MEQITRRVYTPIICPDCNNGIAKAMCARCSGTGAIMQTTITDITQEYNKLRHKYTQLQAKPYGFNAAILIQ